MKVAVIGSKGMLGVAVYAYFKSVGYEVVDIHRGNFDITKQPITDLEPRLNATDAIINCAGVIKPRIKDMSIEDVLKINSVFPKNLGKLGQHLDCPVIHITTDCVYSGKKGPYTESSLFDADDTYGMTKNAGEDKEWNINLRTSIIGEERLQSRSLLEWAKSQAGKAVNGFTNHLWNGITTLQFAKCVKLIIENEDLMWFLTDPGFYRLAHIYSPKDVNKFELLNIINTAYDLNLNITATEAVIPCDRRLRSIYSISDDLKIPTLDIQLKELREFFVGI